MINIGLLQVPASVVPPWAQSQGGDTEALQPELPKLKGWNLIAQVFGFGYQADIQVLLARYLFTTHRTSSVMSKLPNDVILKRNK